MGTFELMRKAIADKGAEGIYTSLQQLYAVYVYRGERTLDSVPELFRQNVGQLVDLIKDYVLNHQEPVGTPEGSE